MIPAASRREAALRRLGIVPRLGDLVAMTLDDAIGGAEKGRTAEGIAGRDWPSASPPIAVLDAGCGGHSALERYRARIGRFVGVDVHQPGSDARLQLDEFAVIDVCTAGDAFPAASFDLVLSAFTVEHLADPAGAFSNFNRWLRPGGTLVLTTVNRRHPFVAAYLEMPDALRRRLQPYLKATAADAHPTVGVCNDPEALRSALANAGFGDIRVQAVGHLARAWGRHLPTFALGLVGDLLTRDIPSRRSTLLVSARGGPLSSGSSD